jgi:uncharacterized membrane protein YecN with MAPEG domain
MMSLPYTSLLTGLFAVLMVVLALLVSFRRRVARVSLGDGNDEILRRRIRAHGNFAEFAPLGLILLGMIEYTGAPTALVIAFAFAVLFSRVLHACGMIWMSSVTPRFISSVVQHTAFIVAGVWLISHALV